MYGICTSIWPKFMVDVGKYNIHRASGILYVFFPIDIYIIAQNLFCSESLSVDAISGCNIDSGQIESRPHTSSHPKLWFSMGNPLLSGKSR